MFLLCYIMPSHQPRPVYSFAAEELRADNDLRDMARDQFIDRLAYHYEQFNYLHPFREGNGRTQRVFWNRVARDAGWQLDWRSVRGAANDQACRAAAERSDFEPLREMFDQIVTKAAAPAYRDGDWHADERARLSFLDQGIHAFEQSPQDPPSTP